MATIKKTVIQPPGEMGGEFMHRMATALNRWTEEIDKVVDDELDRLEGRRFLLRQLASSVEIYIESGSADHPHFHNVVSDIRKVFADSPDTDYRRAHIQLKRGAIYRLYGNIPSTTLYYGVQLYRPRGLTGKNLSDEEIPRRPNGDFELYLTALSPQELPAELKDKPVLRGDGDEIAVIVRQYFADRTKEVPLTLNIMRVDANAPKLLRHFLDRNFFAEGARRALANLEFTMENTLRAHNGISMLSFNHFVNGNGTNLFPTLDNRYMVAYFDNLAVPEKEDDAPVILIRSKIPNCRYFSVCLYNRWLESLDYVHRQVYFNHTYGLAKLTVNKDGVWELAVSNVFPGHVNWMDATGHSSIYVITRELLPKDQDDPEFEVIRTTVGKMHTVGDRFFQQGAVIPSKL